MHLWPEAPTLACVHGKPFVMYSPCEARPFYQMLSERFARAGVVPDIVEHIVLRKVATDPVHLVATYRRDNDNPVLALLKQKVLASFHPA